MDIDKLKNAKNNSETVSIDKQLMEANKQKQRLEQELLFNLKTVIDATISRCINELDDEKLDELLKENIFKHTNDEDNYILYLYVEEFPMLELKIRQIYKELFRGEDWYNKESSYEYMMSSDNVLRMFVFNTPIVINLPLITDKTVFSLFKENSTTINNNGKFSDFYNKDGINIGLRLVEESGALSEDWKDGGTFYKTYKYSIFKTDDFKRFETALYERLTEYGLKIIDMKVENNDMRFNYCIKFKNPLI